MSGTIASRARTEACSCWSPDSAAARAAVENHARDSFRFPRSRKTIAVIPAICPAVRHNLARTGAGCGMVSSGRRVGQQMARHLGG
ncbi:hypothetical protein GCM10010521_22850 [Streptomyces rameus]|uniref:Uncharacterized protein n=1 Tax=Streptomyces rameus TaxID=68261 RepID=A0ABP6N4E6_9ACTN